jgi:hypothetical protein
LDSAPLFDAVATQDTVTLIRSAIRGLLRVVPAAEGATVRALLTRDDDYAAAGKPVCDWDDAAAREQLVDALVRDGYRASSRCAVCGWTRHPARRPSCWRLWSARISRRSATGGS